MAPSPAACAGPGAGVPLSNDDVPSGQQWPLSRSTASGTRRTRSGCVAKVSKARLAASSHSASMTCRAVSTQYSVTRTGVT
jgi:hypothetical protein